MTTYSIDFESRSGTDIKAGLPAYLSDPEFDVLCMALGTDVDDVDVWVPGENEQVLARLHEHVQSGGRVRAWNAAFEWHVWNLYCVPELGWPELRWEQLVDTMAEAAAMNLPQGLDSCTKALGLPKDQQKDKRGKHLIRTLCMPQDEPEVKPASQYKTPAAHKGAITRHRTWQEKGGRWINDPALLQELWSYCRQDVISELSAARKLLRLLPIEQQAWVQTQVINRRGVPIAVDEIRSILSVVERERERLNGELRAITGEEVGSANERDALLNWCNARLDEWDWLEDLQSETIEDFLLRAEHDPYFKPPADVQRALRIRLSAGLSSVGKFDSMLRVVDYADHRVRNMIVYHGASTGRDASRGGLNLQNLVRPVLKKPEIPVAHQVLGAADHDLALLLWGDHVMHAAAACVRGVIKAPPGMEFIDADFSSVENRVGVWLADQMDKLAMFAAGYDEYKVFSSTALHNIPYEQVNGDQRQMSKSAVLGCLFGQGWRGLINYAKGYGVLLSEKRAQEIVKLYREQYHKVKALWYRCGDAAIEAVCNPGTWVAAGSKLKLMAWRNFLWLQLPSGRRLAWAAPRVEMKPVPWDEEVMRPCVTVVQVDSMTHQWRRDKLIGSSIFQSAVQAIARDLLMHGVRNVEAQGYEVVLRVHDELLALVRAGFGSVEDFCACMVSAPEWANGLPLAAEGWRGDRLRK